MKKSIVTFLSLFALSIILYSYKFPQMAAFDADQDLYALQYLTIFKEKKLTLLGIEASVGGVFVAPLYTYFSSVTYALSLGNPIGIFSVSILIAAMQGPLTYLLFSKLKNQRTGLIAGLIAVFSHALWQKAFAPSVIGLSYLFGLLFFYYLATLPQKPKNIIVLGLICGISISLHVSLFTFIPLTILYLLWLRPKNIKPAYYSLAAIIILALFSPLILFDIRHNFFLTNNMLDFLNKSGSSGTNPNYFSNFTRVFKSIFNMYASFLVPQPIFGKLLVLSAIPYLLTKLPKDKNVKTAWLVILVSFLMFSFYFGSFSDYYFYFLLAPFLFVFASLLSSIFSRKSLYTVPVVVLSLMFLSNFQMMQKSINPYNYFIKEKVAGYIKGQAGDKKIKIYFDAEPGLGVGFNYLFKRFNINLSEDNYGDIYQIVVKGKEHSPGAAFQQDGVENTIRVVKLDIP